VNVVDLDAVLASAAVLDKDYIDGLEGTLKGFHTIEYLLFGTAGGTKTAADFTARELEYLQGTTQSLLGAATQLREEWDPAGGNYAGILAGAGTPGNAVYISESAALQELVDGMIGICDEVANGKISDPFDQGDRTLEESQFSDNSNSDFADNIRSVQNVYLGTYLMESGAGVRQLVLALQPALDATIQAQITAAITSIGLMTPSFGEAIFTNTAAVEAARTSIRALQQTLESQLRMLTTQ
jgi:putative iron-regulated protein